MIYLKSNDVLLFQGDSITHGGRVESSWDENHLIGHGYQDFIAQTLGVDNIERAPRIVNRGVSADNIEKIYARMQEDILDIKPTIMSILDGTNDASAYILRGLDMPPESYNATYRRLLDTVLKHCPDIRLIICQPFRYIMPESTNNELNARLIDDVKQRSRIAEQIAKDYNAVFVRFWDALDEYVGKYPVKQIVWDGIHPTYIGHGIMARCWLETVEKAYSSNTNK